MLHVAQQEGEVHRPGEHPLSPQELRVKVKMVALHNMVVLFIQILAAVGPVLWVKIL